jgi:hypothetical protein
MNDELKGVWKEAVEAKFLMIFRYFDGLKETTIMLVSAAKGPSTFEEHSRIRV